MNRLENSDELEVSEMRAEIRAVQLELYPPSPTSRSAKESNAAYRSDMKALKQAAVAYRARTKAAQKLAKQGPKHPVDSSAQLTVGSEEKGDAAEPSDMAL